ncbi:metal-sensitive transcriptional regulator [Kozakia baliensis]|uniref:Uncharacterized protein n=1 Tax=Kozakia baliensis TaxID=153496 RepID=A0A1D8UVG6_9PROT|nr:metal-sensitive transcriptional regulator [Kozakia baliensis]AOX17644.1 hypothetical protein A0U89_11365 [Kozakia baliensis]GBR31323.1 hypothetical protein AA0488_2247 [Kozakia baliensis NRIC 0488]GEL62864.1 copper-sensing transcriptional repressor CsoR [Kozakia baliensis]
MADNHDDIQQACSQCAPSDVSERPHVTQPDKKALTNRLRRIEGQISGVRHMVEDDRYCVDILTQISAVKAALDSVAVQILSSHANGCVRRAVMNNGGDAEIDELLKLIRKMIR